MKKKIFTIAFALLIICTLSITVFANVLGDINGDGKIAAADARKVLRHSAGIELLSDEAVVAADVDGNGKITASDARKIMREAAGLTKNFQSIQVSGKLVEDGVLNVALCVSGAPFAYSEAEQYKGIAVDMASKVASYYDLELSLHVMTTDEAAASLRNNQCDLAFVAVDCYGGATPDGLVTYQYSENIQKVYFRNKGDSTLTINDLKTGITKTVGVVKESVSDVILTKAVENGEFNCNIKRYDRFIDGINALSHGSIDAFVGQSNGSYNGIAFGGYLATDFMMMAAASEKQELFDVFRKPLSDKVINSYIDKYAPAKSDSSISLDAGLLAIPQGGTSIMKINIDSYYGYTDAKIVSSPYDTQIVKNAKGSYLVISIPKGASNGTIKLAMLHEPDVIYDLQVEVLSDVLGVYNFGMENSQVPDFGTIVSVAPEEVNIYTQDNAVAYIYSAQSLVSAGASNEHIEYFFALLEYQGFSCVGEDTGDAHYQLTFKNETTGETVMYTESYIDPYYLDPDSPVEFINIYLYHEF